MLLTSTALAIYKPAGVTSYGMRKQEEQDDIGLRYGVASAPRWVKVLKAIAIVMAVLFVIMIFHGGHGPGSHVPPNS